METSKEPTGSPPACAASSQGEAARRGIRRIPEGTRVASAQELDTARSATHRPREIVETRDGSNAAATVGSRGATVTQGVIGTRSERKNRHEGDFEGEQSPGRVGQQAL